MSRKDYVAIAEAIAREAERHGDSLYRRSGGPEARIAKQIADYCEAENERFDRLRFLEACGVA